METAPGSTVHKKDLEASLATLLTAGTALAALVLIIGIAWYLTRDHATVLNFRVFEPHAKGSVFSVVGGAWTSGAGLMQLGVVLLILTPIARVFFTLVAFLIKRDWMYVVVTAIVLGALLYGLFGEAALE
ncbi:MAG: DUF1634 domain-containing protein [Phycisphaerales bacterium]